MSFIKVILIGKEKVRQIVKKKKTIDKNVCKI